MTPRRAQNFGMAGRSAEPWQRPTAFGQLSWTVSTSPGLPPECGRHPLADQAISQALRHRADEIDAAFNAIEPVLRDLAPRQFEDGFARLASSQMLSRLHLDFSADLFAADWLAPLDMKALHARCIVGTFCRLIERASHRWRNAQNIVDDAAQPPIRAGRDVDGVKAPALHKIFDAFAIADPSDLTIVGIIDYWDDQGGRAGGGRKLETADAN